MARIGDWSDETRLEKRTPIQIAIIAMKMYINCCEMEEMDAYCHAIKVLKELLPVEEKFARDAYNVGIAYQDDCRDSEESYSPFTGNQKPITKPTFEEYYSKYKK